MFAPPRVHTHACRDLFLCKTLTRGTRERGSWKKSMMDPLPEKKTKACSAGRRHDTCDHGVSCPEAGKKKREKKRKEYSTLQYRRYGRQCTAQYKGMQPRSPVLVQYSNTDHGMLQYRQEQLGTGPIQRQARSVNPYRTAVAPHISYRVTVEHIQQSSTQSSMAKGTEPHQNG